jgi:hypothetical protein
MIPSYEDVKNAREALKEVAFNHWVHHDLFTWKWWFLLAATIVPWIIWLLFHDKKKTFELLSYGLIWATLASILDVIGGELILWGYPDKLLPMVPPLFPADITVIPVLFMFIYQHSKTFSRYFIFSVLGSALFSYIFEPLFIKGNMFILHDWTHTKSFLGFIILSQIVYLIVTKLKSNTKTYKM